MNRRKYTDQELKDILNRIEENLKGLKEDISKINVKLYVIDKRLDSLENKLDIIIVNDLR